MINYSAYYKWLSWVYEHTNQKTALVPSKVTRVDQISTGQVRRVTLARVLLCDPPLVV